MSQILEKQSNQTSKNSTKHFLKQEFLQIFDKEQRLAIQLTSKIQAIPKHSYQHSITSKQNKLQQLKNRPQKSHSPEKKESQDCQRTNFTKKKQIKNRKRKQSNF